MSLASAPTKIENYTRRWIITSDETGPDLDTLTFVSCVIFYSVFFPLFVIEAIVFNTRFSILIATLVCCWLVFTACRSVSISFKSEGRLLWAFFVVIRASFLIGASVATIASVLLSIFLDEAFLVSFAVPVGIAVIGHFMVRYENPFLKSEEPAGAIKTDEKSFDYVYKDVVPASFLLGLVVFVGVIFCVLAYLFIVAAILQLHDSYLYNVAFYGNWFVFFVASVKLGTLLAQAAVFSYFGCSTFATRDYFTFNKTLALMSLNSVIILACCAKLLSDTYFYYSLELVTYQIGLALFTCVTVWTVCLNLVNLTKNEISYAEIKKICFFNAFCGIYLFFVIIPLY